MAESSNRPKRPRLSLQIKPLPRTSCTRSSRTLASVVNPTSPTSFNTLSNVYVTAIERSTPVQPEPVTAINTITAPRILAQLDTRTKGINPTVQHLGPYLDTPVTSLLLSPALSKDVSFPSSMTATPPLSAGPVESGGTGAFSFSGRGFQLQESKVLPPSSPSMCGTPSWQTNFPKSLVRVPYSHPHSLRSILRNSPLTTVRSPFSPTRRSLRLQEKASKKVAYHNPLEQTITTNRYVKSHVDLLCEDGSPFSPSGAEGDTEEVLDHIMARTETETRDGGHTPGPFEEMRRRMASLGTSSPLSSKPGGGVRKRKRNDKKRQWVWTIGQDEDEEGRNVDAQAPSEMNSSRTPKVPVIAIPEPRPRKRQNVVRKSQDAVTEHPPHPAPPPLMSSPPPAADRVHSVEPPTPSVESTMSVDSLFEVNSDIDMSDASSFASSIDDVGMLNVDMDEDMDAKTPVPRGEAAHRRMGSASRQPLETRESRRDTPIPPEFVPS
ncbi:hypothetical protein VTK73DRAFT_4799 [Phialemonium thermophilum]|uniref:Glucan 1, 4-alpha-glucosidase n=1 Tax=Phialemonium thermophilum TaxID=223376 RepID=A0ABR3XZR5_9PEZI